MYSNSGETKEEREVLSVRLWDRVLRSFLDEVTHCYEGCVGVHQVDKVGEKIIN